MDTETVRRSKEEEEAQRIARSVWKTQTDTVLVKTSILFWIFLVKTYFFESPKCSPHPACYSRPGLSKQEFSRTPD